ncbi:MAG: ATP-binding protein [Chloroflexota bacterium]|nr:ATP-binding protein [Chloroflexota bacterium]
MISLEEAPATLRQGEWLSTVTLAEDALSRPDVVNADHGVDGAQARADSRTEAGLRVFSMVAHELRGPLMALTTSSELLVEDFAVLAPEQIRDMVGGIHCRALWLQGLVENLLAAATLQEGRLHLHIQPTNLIEVVTEVQQVVQPLLQRRGQRLRIRARGPLPDVAADSRRIGQVLVNLVLNASKFSPVGSDVEVTLGRKGDGVQVSVLDRGPGLPPELAERLFEPFYRSPTAEQSGQEGIGLGLAIVKSIVERHGGRVGAENRPQGGARFWFALPQLTP